MTGIFINYRRIDSEADAKHIFKQLCKHFGADHVFIDTDAIAPGAKFEQEIVSALHKCDFMLVIIGTQWATVKGENGDVRLNDPHDFVRREIELALSLGLEIIPVLVNGASVPDIADLPYSLFAVPGFQAIKLQSKTNKPEINTIVQQIKKVRDARNRKLNELTTAIIQFIQQKKFRLIFGATTLMPLHLDDGEITGFLVLDASQLAKNLVGYVGLGCSITPGGVSKPHYMNTDIKWRIKDDYSNVPEIVNDLVELARLSGYFSIECIEIKLKEI